MFEGFEQKRIAASGTEINLVIGGDGPPVLLLHGYPETHVMWHKMAATLAERYTVVATDLRGYGDSDKPPSGEDHSGYSKRAMAQDQVEVMRALGFDRFSVVGHDRGARVGHRLARDHRDAVERLAVLDVCPTLHMYMSTDMDFATAYYHWFFLIQPFDFPERMIGADPEFYLRRKFKFIANAETAITDEAWAEYIRCFSDPATIHATCEDYRAAATIDLEHDRADFDQGMSVPVLALWGKLGVIERSYDPLAVWREHTSGPVTGKSLPCGHFIPEEAPLEALAELLPFLSG
ncbi:MAG: alpha/beta hydrolase [Rhodospirillaceae bacterium]|jgi:haloacetate dehalogenase|nr:alpha/beta hydrolase [Rhodospirillaceae bacterium]MBT6136214.1 alpha/beta hydrolase [Rhodospirillaceae bacterium]